MSTARGRTRISLASCCFFWNILLGRAHMTRCYPEQVGLIDDTLLGRERCYHQMWQSLLQSQREHPALKFGGSVNEGPEGQSQQV
eukprot:gene38548-47601_t